MRFSVAAAAFIPVLSVSAETFTVLVGQNDGLTFSPTSVTAKVGDTVAFQFMAKNHSVTQSTFAAPCQLGAGMIDSGFQSVPQGSTSFPQWSFTLNNESAPLWFFCAQTGHCQKGMVFAVNPTADKSFEAFQANAMASSSNASSASATLSGFVTSLSSTPTGTGSPSAPVSTGGASTTNSAAAGATSPANPNSARHIRSGRATGVLILTGLLVGLLL